MGDPLKISRALAPYKMAKMHGRFGGVHTGPCREMVLVERSLLVTSRGSSAISSPSFGSRPVITVQSTLTGLERLPVKRRALATS